MPESNENASITPAPEGEEIQFTILDENGAELECTVLYFMTADFNGKTYMVYTVAEPGEEPEEVSAAICSPEVVKALTEGAEGDLDLDLQPLTNDVEWALVADTLRRVAPDGIDINADEVVDESKVQLTSSDN